MRSTEAAEKLRDIIRSGTLSPGDKLPTEPRLARELSVSRATLRDALSLLEREGFLERKHGSGTFVKSLKPEVLLHLEMKRSVTELIASKGLIPGTKSLKLKNITATPEIATKLQLAPRSPIIRIERVRTANAQPVVYSIDYIPSWVVPNTPDSFDENFSLYAFLETVCSQKIKNGTATLIPLSQVQSIAKILQIDPNSYLFLFEQVDLNQENKPIVYSREYFVPWIFKFTVLRTR